MAFVLCGSCAQDSTYNEGKGFAIFNFCLFALPLLIEDGGFLRLKSIVKMADKKKRQKIITER